MQLKRIDSRTIAADCLTDRNRFFSVVYQRQDWFQKITRSRVILDSKAACPFRVAQLHNCESVRYLSADGQPPFTRAHPRPAVFPVDIVA